MDGSRRWVLPLLLVGIFTLLGLFKFGLIDRVAPAIAFLVPLAVCGAALARSLRGADTSRLVTVILFACIAAASLIAVDHGVGIRRPAATELTSAAPTKALEAADGTSQFDVFVDASVASSAGAQGSAGVELARAGHIEQLEAAFSRGTITQRAGRRAAVSAGAAHDEERFRVELRGSGPIEAHLTHLNGSIGSAVRVSLAPVPPALRLVEAGLVAAAIGVVLHDALRRERSRVAHLAAAAAAFALYLERRFSPNDAVSTVMAACIVAAVGAGIAFAATALLNRVLSRLKRTAPRANGS